MKIMAEENVTRQLAAIVYADVSGYSRLTEADEIGTHRQLSASLDLIADRIRNSAGEVVHYAGDAVLAHLAMALGAGAEVPEAMALANLAGSIVIGKIGTTGSASVDELAEALGRLG